MAIGIDKFQDMVYCQDMIRSYIREFGYSLQEIGAHMGITRERVRQLMSKKSKRVTAAVKEMKKAKR